MTSDISDANITNENHLATLHNFEMTADEVFSAFFSLKTNKNPRPDTYPKLLEEIINEIFTLHTSLLIII